MLENLFRPWLLARLVPSVVATVLALVAAETALRVLTARHAAGTSEGALAIERRAELVATLFAATGAATVLGSVISVVGADRLRASVRGAMCAYGVLAASPWGFRSLFVSLFASLACVLWLTLHRVDLALRAPELTRAKFAMVLLVAPLVALDLGASTSFALDLDFRMVASCCSTGLEGARDLVTGAGGGARGVAFTLFAGASALTIVASLVARRAPDGPATMVAALSALAASLASLPAVIGYVAPHAYESPTHLCPFCLLDADGGYLGWPLYAALFVATALGLASGLLALVVRRVEEKSAVRAVLSSVLARSALAWSFALALAAYPVARFALVSGGATLFGG